MSYCTGFVLGNVLCGVTYLMFKNKMKDNDVNEEKPTSTQAAQITATNSTISQPTNCNTIDNNNTPEITIRYENILTATANYANLLNNNKNNKEQEEGIEYELTDYMLQNDIETIHSMNSSSLCSSRSSMSASLKSREDTNNNDLQLSYSQEESVYNNFDDLFEIRDSWMTNNTLSGSISLDTDTIIVGLDDDEVGDEARDDNDGSEIKENVSKGGETNDDMGNKDKPNTMPTTEEEGEDGAEVLKKLVIKCLVRNNCKGGLTVKGKSSPRSVRSSGVEKIYPSLPKDPSLEENSNRDPNSRQDPPSAEETSQKYQQQINEQQQHQQGSRIGGGMSVSSINSNRYPPRPDIVRYNNNMVMMQNRGQYKQQPPRPDLIQCNATSVPLSSCHSSYSYSTHAQQLTSPRSVVTNPSLPGVVELSSVIEEGVVGSSYVIGQGELRRRHYKEMLRQQRQKESLQEESPLGCSDSTMIPTKEVPTLV